MTTDEPKTLSLAKDRIAELTAELAQLKTGKASTGPPATIQKPPAVTVTQPSIPKPPVTQPNVPAPSAKTMTAWEKEVARAHSVATANLSSKPLADQTVEELRSALNAEKDPSVRFAIYGFLQKRKAEIDELKRNPLAQSQQRNSGPQLSNDQAPPVDPAASPTWQAVEERHAPPPKSLPASADTPVLIQKILDVTVLDPDLLSMLSNPVHTPLQRSMIYSEVKKRRAIEGVHV